MSEAGTVGGDSVSRDVNAQKVATQLPNRESLVLRDEKGDSCSATESHKASSNETNTMRFVAWEFSALRVCEQLHKT